MPDAFCFVFDHDEDRYAYDVNSGDVISVDSAMAVALGGPAGAGVSAEDLQAAHREIAEAREAHNLFLSHRPTALDTCPACHDVNGYDGQVGQLTLSVSEQCNLRCGYCPHGHELGWIRSHQDERMSPSVARKAVREFLTRSRDVETPSISFYGGEPLLEFDLIREIVDLVRREGPCDDYRFIIDTNGTLLSEEVCAFIVTEGVHLQISLDGPTDIHDRHRSHRGGGPSHAEVEAGIGRLLAVSSRAHEQLRFQVTLAPPTEVERVDTYFADFPPYRKAGIKEAPSVGASIVDLTGINPGDIGITTEDKGRFRDDLLAARQRYVDTRVAGRTPGPILAALFDDGLVSFYHRFRETLGDAISPGGCCRPGQRRLHVRADGAYQPCERVGDGLIIGHVSEGLDLEAVEVLWSRFKQSFGEHCLDCWACRLCSACFSVLAESWERGGMKPEAVDSVCTTVRTGQAETLRMYVELLARNPRSLDFLKSTFVS